MPTVHPSTRRASALVTVSAGVGSLVAIAGVGAIWTGVAVATGSTAGWMAVLTALDAALVLRLANYPTGRTRAAIAVAVLLATVAWAGYLYATAEIGMSMGMRPYYAIGRMSGDLAWLYLTSNTGWVELAWIAVGALVAWKVGR